MPRLRLLAISLLATALPLAAAAQAPVPLTTLQTANPQAAPTPGALQFNLPSQDRVTVFGLPSASTEPLVIPHVRLQAALPAPRTQACAKLRVYGFTARDLQSPHPHASTETDCTLASNGHLKSLNLPATVSPATVSPVTVSPK